MKKFLILLIIAVKINSIQAQEYDTVPPYQRDSMHIPPFTALNADSVYISDKLIPKNKPVVIVYFSPTCGHCQITAQEFGEKMKYMKDVYFVWVAYGHPLSEIKDFAKKFNLQQFNNIMIGGLINYNLPSFYRIKFTPYMAVYNKEHHLIKTYDQGTEADTLIKLLKKE
jgi:thiol-disulfide isomerase/thioredoxin